MSRYTVKDIPLINKARKSRWPMSDNQRADIVRDMYAIATDKEQTESNRIKAADMLRKIDALNLVEEKMFLSTMDADFNLAELTDSQLNEQLERLKALLEGSHVGQSIEGSNVETAAREAAAINTANQHVSALKSPAKESAVVPSGNAKV